MDGVEQFAHDGTDRLQRGLTVDEQMLKEGLNMGVVGLGAECRHVQRVTTGPAPAPSQALTVREPDYGLPHQALNRTAQGMEAFLAAR
mgnify:CR=1 FL=1